MDIDLRLGGSGGDYDPDDGLVDWMQTASKFNGPDRDKAMTPFGFWSETEADAATDEQSDHRRSGRTARAGAEGECHHLQQGGLRVPLSPGGRTGAQHDL